jgi:hypothetical protein
LRCNTHRNTMAQERRCRACREGSESMEPEGHSACV